MRLYHNFSCFSAVKTYSDPAFNFNVLSLRHVIVLNYFFTTKKKCQQTFPSIALTRYKCLFPAYNTSSIIHASAILSIVFSFCHFLPYTHVLSYIFPLFSLPSFLYYSLITAYCNASVSSYLFKLLSLYLCTVLSRYQSIALICIIQSSRHLSTEICLPRNIFLVDIVKKSRDAPY